MKFSKVMLAGALTLLSVVPPTVSSAAPAPKSDYTLMVYMVGSDLESGGNYASTDLKEMMKVGSTKNVNVVVETGGSNDWANGKISNKENQRWLVKKNDIQNVGNIGDKNMGKSESLTDFIDWSMEKYPAKKYGIVLWNHGGGSVAGYGADEKHDYDALTLSELQKAFDKSQAKTNKFDMIGFDACLMGNVEVAKLLQPYGKYLVASEELEPVHGWDYTPFLKTLTTSSKKTGDVVGKVIADAYVKQSEDFGTEDDITLSVVDMDKTLDITKKVESLAKKLQSDMEDDEALQAIAKARFRSEDYGGSGGAGDTDMVDIVDLADQLSSLYPKETKALISSVEKSVIYNINSLGNPRANGLSIYFPSEDRPSFKSNVVKYDKNNFSETYEKFLKGYVDQLLSESKGIKSEKLPLKKSVLTQATTGFEVKVSPEDASSLVNVKGIVGQYEAGSTSKIRVLGADNSHVKLDEKTGIIKGQWNQGWPMLSGQMVPMFMTNQTDQQANYVIPVKINGEKMELVVLQNKQANTYDILGAWRGVDPKTGVPDRNLHQVKEGDKIAPLYPTIDKKTNERGMVDGEEFTAGKTVSLQWQGLPKNPNFLYGFDLTSFAQNHSISDFTAIK
ncbi:clostripain-related cysteine peptidase [Baia soyae]|uniref:Cysteine peptidase C11 family protein n=1 Tax=Baia soyae TaxID=1544746 RepID=A0A4R2S1V2_9BACL|nr:clostripain-related cysteine peptidase [Baia soyae]TCP70205.1 cysteine peptidase C11 family protein [Baia soyae]